MIIVDLDGTVSNCEHRLKHIQGENKDWDTFFKECINDTPIEKIVDLVRNITINMGKISLFLTGRSDIARKETKDWISATFPEFLEGVDYHLVMRPQGNHAPDHELKPKMLEDFLKTFPHLEVDMIFEDRTSVVKKWRELGYTCLQVADGDF